MPVRAEQNHRLNWPNIIDMKEYLDIIKALLKENKTTGGNHSEAMLHYSKMNLSRMKRWMKAGVMNPELEEAVKAISEPQTWVVLTEAWCGDAAHTVPFMALLAELNPNITLDIKMRDENLDLMDKYLTKGGRSIPKMIAFNASEQEVFNWGPRPKKMQEAFYEMKELNLPYSEVSESLQKMYNKDKGILFQEEFLGLLCESNILV
jgi:hypothetical protein